MQIQVTSQNGWTHVSLDGRLDLAGVQAVQDTFAQRVSSPNASAVLDCSKLTFIASMGIGMLVESAKALQRNGNRMVLLRPMPIVEEVPRATGIHNIVAIVHDDDQLQQAMA